MCDDKEHSDTWEDFFGSSPDLLPSIMGAFDELSGRSCIEKSTQSSTCPRRIFQVNNFNLSPNVKKIIANIPDDETAAAQQEIYHQKRLSRISLGSKKTSPEIRSTENLEKLTVSLQKILCNLSDSVDGRRCGGGGVRVDESAEDEEESVLMKSAAATKPRHLCHSKSASSGFESEEFDTNNKPLGSYMHKSPSGIASRTPVGRKNMGKYLQIPSESTNSTLSSEVSRPVSLTSLGSCSSSGSSGLHQQGSAYLASAESLDSDVEPTGSQGSADSGISDSTTTMSPELRVLQEVLDTESVYVQDLRQVIEGYLEPWRTECQIQGQLNHLFSNIEEIYRFNKSFLQHLLSANCDPSQIANVFLQNDSGFSIYTVYCTDYPRTMNVLTELTSDEKTAVLFRERQTALGHALPLGSYLLKPVQRILKYHLLLQRLSKQCESKHKPTVDLALATMTSVAAHINTMKRKHEEAVRIQEIQSQLYGWNGPDLTALGELIAEGTFRVGGARGRRHVFLFDKLLLMAKSKPDGAFAYKTHIMCSNLMLVEQIRGEPLCFHVLPFDNPRLQCTLRARTLQIKKDWTQQIKRVILENYTAVIPMHARQLVMELGQEVEETPEDEGNEKWSPIKQHSTPQYLERRSRVRKTRDFTKRRAASQDRPFQLGSWRRKSDPSGIQFYNTKTMPKKISKIKKAKECATVFYTDLSDSENCDMIGASIDSLNVIKERGKSYEDLEEAKTEQQTKNIAQVVNDLLMSNEEFQKRLQRQRSRRESAEEKLSKSDSLPRSFQLNQQSQPTCSLTISESTTSLQEKIPEIEENDSRTTEDYPEHKIYRKSKIRTSLIQKFRVILSEEQKKTKSPTYKQGSKSMGAKIANPDYADPQKLFPNPLEANTHTAEPTNLMISDLDMDMTINETEVLKELDKRLSQNSQISLCKSSHNDSSNSKEIFNSSHNSDSYYESLLEKSLNDEEKNIEKSDSFRSAVRPQSTTSYLKHQEALSRTPPPPIPTKPKYLSKKSTKVDNKNCGNSEHLKGWVKTMVDRFE